MAVPLHGLEPDRQQRPQPFATDPVGCLPNHDQCLAHSLIVNPATGPRSANPGSPAQPATDASYACGDSRLPPQTRPESDPARPDLPAHTGLLPLPPTR